MTGVLRDVRHAVRWLRASPGFALIAVATIALGIGATSAIFSLANAALLRPMPFADAERLALVYGVKPQQDADLLPLSQPRLRRRSRPRFAGDGTPRSLSIDHAGLPPRDGHPHRHRPCVHGT